MLELSTGTTLAVGQPARPRSWETVAEDKSALFAMVTRGPGLKVVFSESKPARLTSSRLFDMVMDPGEHLSWAKVLMLPKAVPVTLRAVMAALSRAQL